MLAASRLARGVAETVTRESFTISRLTNGLRVITCEDGNGITGMGLFSLNGPKFEEAGSFGAAAVMESLPLRSNARMTTETISQSLGVFGNAYKVTNNREAMSVMLMMPRYHQKEGLDVLNGMWLHPTENDEEFAVAKAQTLHRSSLMSRDATSMLFELVHKAGWSGRGLGNPLSPTEQQLEQLTLERFHAFHRRYTTPERTVLAATGVADHKAFVQEAEVRLQFPQSTAPSLLSSSAETANKAAAATAQLHPYTGGCEYVQNTTAPESMNKFQEKNLSHMALFFQAIPMAHPDYFTFSVIQTLLGGGTSFSSGGPGKGMQTKLFREVLNREPNLHGMECITAWYSDGGLIGLYGSAPHEHVSNLLKIMIFQAASISQRITPVHLEMAKNQLSSQLILLGEGREQLLNDMGFNLLVHNYTITPQETIQGSAQVTMARLHEVSAQLVEHPVTFAVYGETKGMPEYHQLVQALKKSYASLNKSTPA
ncbi:metallo-peptidase - Clan ME - Family M16 [Leishmania donovani]|uniref:Metallo-peptidase_-_Clan_ME_-_Family_M16 n=3 Tax=Leishmania donovani species complex TaxID=38574 RepID=A0A6L0XPU9_LEIIN|nr:putative mitochondrial processing peptidase alpha subunit [Leishmania infantum JPCM5]XP_003864099.1 mitochondrial processing peptidase alpha subunit, putative [Leishmania donovani]CAC9533998.1 metallo-peptidase_-_Clan_ME_-_Family_M16 [Leishmania infantum]AYU82257.1 metallo-peptidase, Clan ME, Family M16 [Leishmania donovani]TPP53605.1 Peptidase M16 inactive domain family protein [Leishmania donovani]TPP55425.1 Peptidase M16 inactive domain family protein [Leishmania donovani]CAJ1992262.1 m|eukprot:XP_001468320.1 putative mitochondrial processing peptidase alpha subunit [Leishmania infantum JPCM5]